MAYVVVVLVGAITVGWIVREYSWLHDYRATCSARLRKLAG